MKTINKKSRKRHQDALIEDDIKHIHDALESGDKELLWNILEGEGFTPYKQQTDKEIDTEYNERGMRE